MAGHSAADDVAALWLGEGAMPPATRITVEAAAMPRPSKPGEGSPPLASVATGAVATGVGVSLEGAQITRLTVTFYPHPHLWITRPVSFEMKISMAYPANPPTVRCMDESFVLEHGPTASLDTSGKPQLHVLSTETLGWNKTYTLADAVHCVRRCLYRMGTPVITSAPQPPTPVVTTGNPASLTSPTGGSFTFSTAGAYAPLSTRAAGSPDGGSGAFPWQEVGGGGGEGIAEGSSGMLVSARARRSSVTSTAEGMAPLRSPGGGSRGGPSAMGGGGAGGTGGGGTTSTGISSAGILAGQPTLSSFGSGRHLMVGTARSAGSGGSEPISGVDGGPSSHEGAEGSSESPPTAPPTLTIATDTAPVMGATGPAGQPPPPSAPAAPTPTAPTTTASTGPPASPLARAEGGGVAAASPAGASARRRASSGMLAALSAVAFARPMAGGFSGLKASASSGSLGGGLYPTPRGHAAWPPGPLISLLSAHSGLQGRRPTMEDAAVWNDHMPVALLAAPPGRRTTPALPASPLLPTQPPGALPLPPLALGVMSRPRSGSRPNSARSTSSAGGGGAAVVSPEGGKAPTPPGPHGGGAHDSPVAAGGGGVMGVAFGVVASGGGGSPPPAAAALLPPRIDTASAPPPRATSRIRSGRPPTGGGSGGDGSNTGRRLPSEARSPSPAATTDRPHVRSTSVGSVDSSTAVSSASGVEGCTASADIGFYSVYDGHGGTRASEFVASRLHTLVVERLSAGQGVGEALYHSFLQVDVEYERHLVALQQNAAAAFALGSGSAAAVPSSDGTAPVVVAPGPTVTPTEPPSIDTTHAAVLGSPVLSAVTPSMAGGMVAADLPPRPTSAMALDGPATTTRPAAAAPASSTASNPFNVPGLGFAGIGANALGDFDNPETMDDQSGCTAIVAVVTGMPGQGGAVTVANAGDSRAVLSRGGVAVPLSVDHKAKRPDERARILAAGGMIMRGRVLGRLAVTRAIGDITLKRGAGDNPLVTAEPELFEAVLTGDDDLLLLACDGIFDVMESQAALDIVRDAVGEGATVEEAAAALTAAAYERGSVDNLTAIVVKVGTGPTPQSVQVAKARRAEEAAAKRAAEEAEAARKAAEKGRLSAVEHGGEGSGGTAVGVAVAPAATGATASAAPHPPSATDSPAAGHASSTATTEAAGGGSSSGGGGKGGKRDRGPNPFSRTVRREQGATVQEKHGGARASTSAQGSRSADAEGTHGAGDSGDGVGGAGGEPLPAPPPPLPPDAGDGNVHLTDDTVCHPKVMEAGGPVTSPPPPSDASSPAPTEPTPSPPMPSMDIPTAPPHPSATPPSANLPSASVPHASSTTTRSAKPRPTAAAPGVGAGGGSMPARHRGSAPTASTGPASTAGRGSSGAPPSRSPPPPAGAGAKPGHRSSATMGAVKTAPAAGVGVDVARLTKAAGVSHHTIPTPSAVAAPATASGSKAGPSHHTVATGGSSGGGVRGSGPSAVEGGGDDGKGPPRVPAPSSSDALARAATNAPPNRSSLTSLLPAGSASTASMGGRGSRHRATASLPAGTHGGGRRGSSSGAGGGSTSTQPRSSARAMPVASTAQRGSQRGVVAGAGGSTHARGGGAATSSHTPAASGADSVAGGVAGDTVASAMPPEAVVTPPTATATEPVVRHVREGGAEVDAAVDGQAQPQGGALSPMLHVGDVSSAASGSGDALDLLLLRSSSTTPIPPPAAGAVASATTLSGLSLITGRSTPTPTTTPRTPTSVPLSRSGSNGSGNAFSAVGGMIVSGGVDVAVAGMGASPTMLTPVVTPPTAAGTTTAGDTAATPGATVDSRVDTAAVVESTLECG